MRLQYFYYSGELKKKDLVLLSGIFPVKDFTFNEYQITPNTIGPQVAMISFSAMQNILDSTASSFFVK